MEEQSAKSEKLIVPYGTITQIFGCVRVRRKRRRHRDDVIAQLSRKPQGTRGHEGKEASSAQHKCARVPSKVKDNLEHILDEETLKVTFVSAMFI